VLDAFLQGSAWNVECLVSVVAPAAIETVRLLLFVPGVLPSRAMDIEY
jgi:hypothetical protein